MLKVKPTFFVNLLSLPNTALNFVLQLFFQARVGFERLPVGEIFEFPTGWEMI